MKLAKTSICLAALLPLTCRSGPDWREPASDTAAPLEGLRNAQPVAVMPDQDLAPSVSRDGRYVAFASEQNGNLDIWVTDYGENSTYPLTLDSAADFDPSISPDGETVAFVSRRSDAKGDLFVTSVHSAGSGLERLTDEGTQDRQPAFSPDGARIYFTSVFGIGLEFIESYDLERRDARRISPTPGFDPAPSPDGRYLIYTAPAGVGGRSHPHLVALRLSDTATRALTHGEAPEGFARFVPADRLPFGVPQGIVYVRFPDDDNGDGALDADDQASLWRLDLDLDALFADRFPELDVPLPLTDGNDDQLFPTVAGPWIYFTQGERQQDILRLPLTGMFPAFDDPAKYLKLAQTIDDPRTRWFAYRCVLARTDPTSMLHGQTLLRIGNLHLERERPDQARLAYTKLADAMRGATSGSPEAELGGIAEVELVSLDRASGLERASAPIDRERILLGTQARLETLANRYAWSERVAARVELELAEVIVDRGERSRAIQAFEDVVREHERVPFSAAKAMLRQIELLGVTYDPDALGEAYARVLRRFPDQRDAVRAAADRIVRVQLEGLQAGSDGRAQVDALSRLIPRYGDSPVRSAARWRLITILLSNGALDDGALHLERMVEESSNDRLAAAKALERLAKVDEARGRLDRALEEWQRLRGGFGDLPGYSAEARDAITRVGARRAAIEEERGNKEAARAAYKNIIDNDLTQVKAHRRYLALSAETDTLGKAIEEARLRAEASPRTPMARYAYALALTWKNPPALEDALVEIEEALSLNPQFTHAYITRGWIREMKALEKPGFFEELRRAFVRSINTALGGLGGNAGGGDFLEQAIADYTRAMQLNPESEDPETESEIWLNDGNASYRLGEKTNDLGNFRKAFSRYVRVLNARYKFQSPSAELVYFERFGRAAAWSEEWAISTMATRRAIALAKRLGQTSRLAQLYGNLSLAYDQAGEDAYARDALIGFADQLELRRLETRLIIAKRNRAVAKLDTVSERTPEMIDSALLDLQEARRLLNRIALKPDRSDERGVRKKSAAGAEPLRGKSTPFMWRPAVEDASGAQFGFGELGELDVNLALAELAHRYHGEESRAEALEERRRFLSTELWDSLPKLLGFVEREPITLVMLRERLGLSVASARARFLEGDRRGSEEILGRLAEELDGWIASEAHLADRPRLLIDRGRLVALRAEMNAMSRARGDRGPKRDKRYEAEIERALVDIDEALRPPEASTSTPGASRESATTSLETADAALGALPTTLSSTLALAETTSIALGTPRFEGVRKEGRAVRARLLYARGLLALSRAELRRTSKSATDLGALIRELDMALVDMASARKAFEAAAREAAVAGPPLGSRIFALSLHAVAAASKRLGDREDSLIRATDTAAVDAARAIGDEEMALAFEISRALSLEEGGLERAAELISAALPQHLRPHIALAEKVLSRSASVALSRGDVAQAVALADRLMLLKTAISPNVTMRNAAEVEDEAFGGKLRRAFDDLRDARKILFESDASTPRETFVERKRAVESSLKRLKALRNQSLSDTAKARIFAEPLYTDLLAQQITADEFVLIPIPLGERVHLLWVDGSTTAPAKFDHLATDLDPEGFQEDVRKIRLELSRNRRAPEDAVARLREGLLSPIRGRLEGKKTLFLADPLVRGPLPSVLWRGEDFAAVHVSAPTAIVSARAVQLVGVDGSVVIAQARAPEIVGGDPLRLREAEAFGFRTGPSKGELVTGTSHAGASRSGARSLDAREPVEFLAERALGSVVVEAPVRLEPAALERSVMLVREPEGAGREGATRESDAAARPKASVEDEGLRGETEAPSDQDDGEHPKEDREDEEGYRDELQHEPELFEKEVPLEALRIPARTLILARVASRPIGTLRRSIDPSDVLRLDLVLAQRGFATTIVVPDVVPIDVVRRIVRRFQADELTLGPARALKTAVDAEIEAAPAAGLIALVGSPGLDAALTKEYAARELGIAKTRASNLFNKEQFRAAVPAFKRWIRLQRESGEDKHLSLAYTALVNILLDRLEKPDPERAADEQVELVRYLEERAKNPAPQKTAANAKVDLGAIYSAAGDHEAAEATLTRAIDDLERLGDRLGVARGFYKLAKHYDTKLDFKRAAILMERAIEIYEAERAFEQKQPPVEAMRAVRAVGAIYLNRLSDPARAKTAFERVLRYAQNEEERNRVVVDLARVARRRGDFETAAELAEQARAQAVKSKRPDLEVDAVTEAANVAWYQGDYRQGQDLCNKSLTMVDGLKADHPSVAKQKKKRKIYALSVCGLLAMSRREFSLAKQHLERARKIAEAINDRSEIATQYNNLGRVYLEFGEFDLAIDSFQKALAIDEELDDRFALAYDFRNLGTALAYRDPGGEAVSTLERALTYSVDVQDANNELRARFALAELARERGELDVARRQYEVALPLAKSLDVKELDWQIHRALGLMHQERGDLPGAEAEFQKAVRIVRSITGRTAVSDFGPQRYAVFDELAALYLEQDRTEDAFLTADLARRLEQTELLDDGRIVFASRAVPDLLREAREASTSSAAEAALEKIEAAEPRLAPLFATSSVRSLVDRTPKDAALVVYRVADEQIVCFVIDATGIRARRTAVTSRELRERVREYGRRLAARGDLHAANLDLARLLLDPIRDLIAPKQRVAIVPHGILRYVAFSALPFGNDAKDAMIDRFVIVQALDAERGVRALSRPLGPISSMQIIALGAGTPRPASAELPLPFAEKEIEVIREEYPGAVLFAGDRVTKGAFLSSLGNTKGVLHFAGHSRLGSSEEGGASFVDPLGGELRTADGGVRLLDVLAVNTKAELVVLSACSSMLSRSSPGADALASGDEILSLAQTFQIAGARGVIATTIHVHDIAAAMLMKRFYRSARQLDVASALREAQIAVRRYYPHPAWWATFVLLGGG